MILSKISIGCFLLRISVKRTHTWIIYSAMFVSTFACAAFFFVTLFQCNPVKYFWAKSLPNGTCINNTVIIGLGFVYSIFSIIADFTFALLPAALVWNLQLKRRTKIALIPLLTMGCVASAAVIARLPFLTKLNSPDFLCKPLQSALGRPYANSMKGTLPTSLSGHPSNKALPSPLAVSPLSALYFLCACTTWDCPLGRHNKDLRNTASKHHPPATCSAVDEREARTILTCTDCPMPQKHGYRTSRSRRNNISPNHRTGTTVTGLSRA
jgi:hypothetical protein